MGKPQLIAQEFMGQHNADLKGSTARIMRGASWKKQRVILIIPASDLIPAKVYLNHCCIVFPPNQSAHRMLALGQEVGQAYSHAIEQVLSHPELSKWEYIFTLEHDNLVPPDCVLQLIQRMEDNPHLSAISALYWTKGPSGVPQIWGRPDLDPVLNYRPSPPIPGQVVEAYGIGMGAAIWRLSMFKDKKLTRPWFRTVAGKEGVGTQDLAFASDARKHGYRFGVDCACLSGHYDYEGKFGPPDTVY